METLIRILGRLLAALPDSAVRAFCVLVGFLVYCIPGRRRLVLNNLLHAFPAKTAAWRRRIARENFARMIEMFLFAIAAPAFSPEALRKRIAFSEETLERMDSIIETPVICGVAHLTMMECLTMLPLLDSRVPQTGSFYRPLDFKPLDNVVREARQRHGTVLLSRREDLLKARRILGKKGWMGVLFDQNAGGPGGLITMFDRVASATDLPGILAGRNGAQVYTFFPERTGFWRARIHVEKLHPQDDTATISVALHDRLAKYLASSDNRCADWLWAHQRWKVHSSARYRFSLAHNKRNHLDLALQYHGLRELPRNEHFIIRLPYAPEALSAVQPLVARLRAERPDARITYLVPENVEGDFDHIETPNDLRVLPRAWHRRLPVLLHLRSTLPDNLLVLDPSQEAGLEAKLLAPIHSYGVSDKGDKRYGIKHVCPIERTNERSWEEVFNAFFHYFGIPSKNDRTDVS